MNPERWARLQELLSAAWELPEAERRAFLDLECGDAELKREAESILAAEEGSETFLGSLAEAVGLRGDDEPQAPLSGRRIGSYRLLEPLGRGGMGVVYLAERADGAFEQQVAIKLLAMGLAGREGHDRFVAERQILAGLEHPAIARLLDGGVTGDGTPYFVMERVAGERIDTWCDGRRSGIRERIELLCRVCEAVEYAHRRLIVHRDLKPANVLVTEDGDPKLLDFGVAKLLTDVDAEATRGRTVAPLTPAWAAPEQLTGGAVTTATDTYALGALAYHLLVGVPPYDETEPTLAAALKRLRAEPPSPSRRYGGLPEDQQAEIARARGTTPSELRRRLAGDLDAVLLRALAPEPERRYGSAGALAADLEAHLTGRLVAARPPSFGYRLARFVGRHRLAVASTSVMALLLISLVVASVRSALHNRRLAERVTAERDRAEEVTAFLVELFELSEPARARGRDITARELLARGDERIRTRLADQPETRAAMLAALGRVYRRLGEPERAAGHLQEAVRIYRRLAVNGAPQVPDLLQEAGAARATQTRWREAEAFLREALRGHRALHGPRDPRVADTLALLGQVLVASVTRYEEAERILRRALALQRQIYGERDHRVASTLVHLGLAAGHQGRFDEVEELLLEGAAIYRERPEEVTSEYAFALRMLGNIAIFRREYETAEEIVREGLQVFDTFFGPDHYETAGMLYVAAELENERGELAAAERHIRRAATILEAPPEPQWAQLSGVLRLLTTVLTRDGRFAEAEASARRSVALARQHEAPIRVASSLWLLGGALREQRRYAAARRVYEEVLGPLASELPPGHSLVALAEWDLGVLAGREGRWDEAEARLRRALAMYEPLASRDSPRLATFRLDLSRALIERGRNDEASRLLDEALPVLEAAFGADDPRARDARILSARLAVEARPNRIEAPPG
ncbi:MAG: tetratricopeptide repeat protein [Thermoanaerobaculia bacterium]